MSTGGLVPPDRLLRPEPEKYEGEIYQPHPFLKWLMGWTTGFWHHTAAYDESQRVPKVWPPVEANEQFAEITFWERIFNSFTFKAGTPHKGRPWPYKDSFERSGFCPEEYWVREWKFPRRTFYNKYIPPPKEGVYEDIYHIIEHFEWAFAEYKVYQEEATLVRQELGHCQTKNNPAAANHICAPLWDIYLNLLCHTNVSKAKMLIWSGQPAIKDGGFKVRY
eukprot:TRINITY_DN11764_c0_g4_i1.p1 TRINITY_DN11764_c0_g4~~TRINITY_DN11764_c0_g4_i1.p1  ORF type:complete len:221 (+),score=90.51 TRINITY_DN11764_c0_g4_i1:144-806(+)